jgi:arabinose-5-phosphate isomerase
MAESIIATPISESTEPKPRHPNGNPQQLLAIARRVIDLEGEALALLAARLGSQFLQALDSLHACKGKIIVTGLGKSGIAAKKIAATLASTGAPSLFLHSSEAIHGDMGVISAGDVAIAISYSGETAELVELVPRMRLLGVPVIALTGKPSSSLATLSDCHLDVSVPTNEWPFGLIPTASSATTVAVGDALAIALLVRRGLHEEDFALLHPGGLLGRKMLVKVRDLMHTGEALPVIPFDAGMREAVVEMTAKRLGVTCVVDQGRLAGIITDGDLRRLLERNSNPFDFKASQVMIRNPKMTSPDILAAAALHEMESHSITSLPVVGADRELVGLIHIHDIVKLETTR